MTSRCTAQRDLEAARPLFERALATYDKAIVGADARPNWREQPPRESLTGAQWR
jgi:hypothetical protein